MFEQKIAFIGLGVMGEPMATNFVNAGYPLTVHELEKSKA